MTTPDCPGHRDTAVHAAEGPKEKAFPTSVNDGGGDGGGGGEDGFPTSVNSGDAMQAALGDTALAGNASVDTAATAGVTAVGSTVEDPPEYMKAEGPKEKAFPTSVNDQTT
jgi:hypothetical protein